MISTCSAPVIVTSHNGELVFNYFFVGAHSIPQAHPKSDSQESTQFTQPKIGLSHFKVNSPIPKSTHIHPLSIGMHSEESAHDTSVKCLIQKQIIAICCGHINYRVTFGIVV